MDLYLQTPINPGLYSVPCSCSAANGHRVRPRWRSHSPLVLWWATTHGGPHFMGRKILIKECPQKQLVHQSCNVSQVLFVCLLTDVEVYSISTSRVKRICGISSIYFSCKSWEWKKKKETKKKKEFLFFRQYWSKVHIVMFFDNLSHAGIMPKYLVRF